MPAKKSDDDLFAETTMTFGEHLEELRSCLWKALIGLMFGTIIGFFLGDAVVAAIAHPLKVALKKYYRSTATKEYEAYYQEQTRLGRKVPYELREVDYISAPSKEGEKEFIYEVKYFHAGTVQESLSAGHLPQDPTKPPVATPDNPKPKNWDEAAEGKAAMTEDERRADALKRYNRDNLVPFLMWHPIDSDPRFRVQATGASEAFTVWLKAALVIGCVISAPWVFYQIWAFVASGLYPTERKYVYLYLPFSLGLFFIGAATAYLFVFEPVLDFLLSFNQSLAIDPDPKISEWLSFVLMLPLGFGISFQLPLVMLFMERIGVITVQGFLEKWRIAVLVIFVISAILTPADPYSIFFLAVPLTVLYFLGILLAKYLPK